MKKSKYKARTLVLGYLERIASKAFEDFPKQVTELIGKQHGVYALYKGNRLYYVGLASNLRGRVNHHLRDKHAGKWDRFSVYLVRKVDHIKELESLLLRIADPKGNLTRGRLEKAENLKSALQKKIRQEQDRQIGIVMGTKTAIKSKKKPKKKKGQPTLAPYVKNRFEIRAPYKGRTYKATVRSDGTINYNGATYNSPSMAGYAIVKTHAVDGWHFWRYKNHVAGQVAGKKGEWVKLDELRK